MSLSKIPVTFIVSLAFKLCVTPPHPPPPKSERIKTASMDVEWYTQTLLPIAAGIQWAAAAAEIATILAWNYPSSTPAQFILAHLVLPSGRPDALRLHIFTVLGSLLMITGTTIRVLAYRALGALFRFEAAIQREHRLVVRGPYSFVRHPGYAGLVLAHPGWVLWQLGRGAWVRESGLARTPLGAVAVAAYAYVVIGGTLWTVLRRMRDEDVALRARFGEEWERWAERVPYLVVPGVY